MHISPQEYAIHDQEAALLVRNTEEAFCYQQIFPLLILPFFRAHFARRSWDLSSLCKKDPGTEYVAYKIGAPSPSPGPQTYQQNIVFSEFSPSLSLTFFGA